MRTHISIARFGGVAAAALVIFFVGIVSGAAGDALILGSADNDAGTGETILSASGSNYALVVRQSGPGNLANAIRGESVEGTGGVFTSAENNALFAIVNNGNRYAIAAVNRGLPGSSGALLAQGNENPGVVVEVDPGVPPITVSSDVVVTNLNADLLDGLSASELSRVSLGAEASELALGDAFSRIAGTRLTAPEDGFVVVSANVTTHSASSACGCEVVVRVRHPREAAVSSAQHASVGASAGSSRIQSIAVTWVFAVSKGPQAFDLEARNLDAAIGDASAQFGQLSALYVPFGPSGEGTLEFDGTTGAEPTRAGD